MTSKVLIEWEHGSMERDPYGTKYRRIDPRDKLLSEIKRRAQQKRKESQG